MDKIISLILLEISPITICQLRRTSILQLHLQEFLMLVQLKLLNRCGSLKNNSLEWTIQTFPTTAFKHLK